MSGGGEGGGVRNEPLKSQRREMEILTAAAFAVRGREETLVAQAAVRAGEVLAAAVRTHAGFETLVDVWAGGGGEEGC